jgi:hypothetical protein
MHNLIRRGRWLLLGCVGVGVLGGRWIISAASDYLSADLAARDQISSILSLWVGVASLTVAILGHLLQRRTDRLTAPTEPTRSKTIPTSGMASLAVPDIESTSLVLGRDALVADLSNAYRRRLRSSDRVHILHGMGGVGKTTAAILVAQILERRGSTTWWISAATRTDLETGMRQLAARIGASAHELDFEWTDNAPDVLWRHLAARRNRWLLIIDNADDPSILAPIGESVAAKRGWVRPTPDARGAILVTSRNGEAEVWGSWCHLHAVKMLSVADGAQVLLRRAGSGAGTPEAAAALARRLGGLPLALTIAGRYLASMERIPIPGSISTFADYQRNLDADGIGTVFSSHGEAFGAANARNAIDSTWELSLDMLDRRGLPQARSVLRVRSVMADSPVPNRLLLNATLMSQSPLFPGLDPRFLATLLNALAGLGLVELDSEGKSAPAETLRVHPLVRDVSRHHLERSSDLTAIVGTAARLLYGAVTDGRLNSAEDPAEWPQWRLFAPHALHLAVVIRQYPDLDIQDAEVAIAAAQRATRFLGAARLYVNAITECRRLVETSSHLLGDLHPHTLLLRTDLAWWTGQAGNPKSALEQLGEVLPARELVSGPENADTLTVRADFAEWTGRSDIRNAASARDLYASLLPIRERVSGKYHVDTILAQWRYASWVGLAGDPDTARDRLCELLPTRELVSGKEHLDTLNLRLDIAEWTGRAGGAEEARDQSRGLLFTCQRVLGENHLDTLCVRVALAEWTGAAGDPGSAQEQLEKLLPVLTSKGGANSPHTLKVRRLLAAFTHDSNQDQID